MTVPDLALGPMPVDATPTMHRVADDLRWLMGLSVAAGEWRALPYSIRFCARRMGLAVSQACQVLGALVKAGVVARVALPPRGTRSTYAYMAPVSTLELNMSVLGIEPEGPVAAPVDAAVIEPGAEIVDEPMVAGAETALANDVGMVAATGSTAEAGVVGRGGAGLGLGHEASLTENEGHSPIILCDRCHEEKHYSEFNQWREIPGFVCDACAERRGR